MGRERGYPKSLALDRFWTTKHFGVLFVPPLAFAMGLSGYTIIALQLDSSLPRAMDVL